LSYSSQSQPGTQKVCAAIMPTVQQKLQFIMRSKPSRWTEYIFGFVLVALMVLVFFVDNHMQDLRSCAVEFGTDIVCVVVPIVISCVLRRGSTKSSGSTTTKCVDARKTVPLIWNSAAHVSQGMQETLSRPRKSDKSSASSLVQACAKRGDMVGADQQLQAMRARNLMPDVNVYKALMDCCARLEDAEAAQKCFRDMVIDGVARSNAYGIAIHMHANCGSIDQAKLWFQKMMDDGVEPTVAHYNALIGACATHCDVDTAEKYVAEIEERGLVMQETTMAAIILVCAKVGDVKRAETWMETLKMKGLKPNLDVYTAMMDLCAQACNHVGAAQWFRALTMAGGVPNSHSMKSLVSSCATAGDSVSAVWWLRSTETSGVSMDVEIYSCVLDLLIKSKDTEQAKHVYGQMHRKGIHPTIVTYSSLARALAHVGEWREVEALASDMQKHGQSMNDYFLYALLLAYATSKPRQSWRAEQAFQEASSLGIQMNGHIFSALQRSVGRIRGQQLIEKSKMTLQMSS